MEQVSLAPAGASTLNEQHERPRKDRDHEPDPLRRRLLQHRLRSKQAECVLGSDSAYGPARGRRIQAVVKLHAHNVVPSSLPRDAALALGRLLVSRLGRSLLVLGGAVRYGCVTLQVDMYQPHEGPQQSSQHPRPRLPQGMNQGSTSADSGQQQAQEDVMGSLPDVVAGWVGNAQVSEHLEPGTLMMVQVGDKLQRFMWSVPNWVQVDSPEQELPSITSFAYSLSVGFPVAVLPPHEGGHSDQPSYNERILEWRERQRELLDPSLVAQQQQQHKQQHKQQHQGEAGEEGLLLDMTTLVGLQPGQQLVGWVSDEHEAGAQRDQQPHDSTVRLLARWQGSHVPLSICGVEEISHHERTVRAHLQLRLPPHAAHQPSVLLLELWSHSDMLLAPAAEMLLLPSHMASVAHELQASLSNQQQQQSGTSVAGAPMPAQMPASLHSVQFSREGAAEFLSDLTDWMRGIDTNSVRSPSSVTDFSSERHASQCGTPKAAELERLGSSAPVNAFHSLISCSSSGIKECGPCPQLRSISGSLPQFGGLSLPECLSNGGSGRLNGEGSALSAEVSASLAQSHEQQVQVLTSLGRDLLQQAVVWGMPALADTLLQGLLSPPCSLSFQQLANGGTHDVHMNAQQHARSQQGVGEGGGGGNGGGGGSGANGGMGEGVEGVDESSSTHTSEPLLGLALRSRSEAMLAQVLAWGHMYAVPPPSTAAGEPSSQAGSTHDQQQQQQQQGCAWDWHAVDGMGVSPLMLAQGLFDTHPWLIDLLVQDTLAGPPMLQAWLAQQPDQRTHPSHAHMSTPVMPPLTVRQLWRIAVYLVLLLRCTCQGFAAPRGGRRGGLLRAVREARARMYGLQLPDNDEERYRDADTPPEKLAEDNYSCLVGLHNLNLRTCISYLNITMALVCYTYGMKMVGFIPQLRHIPLYASFIGANIIRLNSFSLPVIERWHVRSVDLQWLLMSITATTFGPSTGCISMIYRLQGDAGCAILYAFMDLVPVVPHLLWRAVTLVASIPLYTMLGFEHPWLRAIGMTALHLVLGVSFLCWLRHKALSTLELHASRR